jgi:RND family efflux transporter MFP subunit
MALGLGLSAALFLPGVIVMRSSSESPPEPPTTATTEAALQSLDSLPKFVPEPEVSLEPEPTLDAPGRDDDRVEQDVASLAPTPEPTDWDAPVASELLGIETSTTDPGGGFSIHLRADGAISNADAFALDNPRRLVIDLPDMVSGMASSRVNLESERIAAARVGSHDGRVRVVLDAAGSSGALDGWRVEPAPDGLLIRLGMDVEVDHGLAASGAEPAPPASIGPRGDAMIEVDSLVEPPAPDSPRLPLYLMGENSTDDHEMSSALLEGSYDCIIEPFELVEVGSALTAVVETVEVERSDFVTAGEVLARLAASPERAAVAVASARATMDGGLIARQERMKLGWRKQKRAEQLFESDALSDDLRDEIWTEAKVATAALQEAREQKNLMALEYQEAIERLDEHTIRSPITGVVVERLKSRGEVVKEETILVLAQIDPLHVEVILPAALFGSVRPGMRVEVSPEIPDAAVRVASVALIDRVIDGTSGTFGVRLELPNPDNAMPSGLRCRVRFLQIE